LLWLQAKGKKGACRLSVTISEIAKLAGVSHSTVSRVLNGAPIRISAARRQQILALAEHLNYIPHRSAQALRTGRHGRIGVIAYDITDAFAVEYIAALEGLLRHTPYHATWLSCAYADQSELKPLQLLQEVAQGVDGLIIVLAHRYLKDADILRFWSMTHLPMVSVIRRIPGEIVASVTIDNRAGTEALLQHLTEQGHRRIAFCRCEPENPSAADRHVTYREIMNRYGWDINPAWEVTVDGTYQDGYAAGIRLLEQPETPTAIIAFNDLTAIGLIKACFDKGLRVPEDISIAGYDNIRTGEMIAPALTTVGANYRELAERAWQELHRQIETKNEDHRLAARHFISQPQLVVRQSTGPARP